jgi:hypothetical protein
VGPGELDLGELRRAVREQAGLDVVSLVPAGGESGAAFWLRDRDGAAWLLKVTSAPVSGLQALDAMTGRLRARGYPAPRLRAVGQLPTGGRSGSRSGCPVVISAWRTGTLTAR